MSITNKTFKALFISDLHGGFIEGQDSLPENVDILFFLGDNGEMIVRNILEIYPEAPAYGVAGNHDGSTPFVNTRIIDLHGQAAEVYGLIIAGLGGCIKYKGSKSKWLLTEKEANQVLESIPIHADIIISHSPPAKKNSNGHPVTQKRDTEFPEAHRGFIELGKYLDKHSPRAVFHGHLHKCQDYFHNNTLVKGIYGIEEVYFEKYPTCLRIKYYTTKILRPENQKEQNNRIRTHIEERLKRFARQIRWWPSPPGS